ncbi:DNA polymerase III subunit delta' [Sphingomonas sp. ASV193]|uniref:DNA polymerase III subunit delta' n=1 Tax=Sphingomonas sp. ASV193 TaxID=3144405 RepID=UPI0032E8DF5E
MIVGHDRAIDSWLAAWASRRMHHAWLVAGPRGVGKASFARAAALRVLAEAAGPRPIMPGIEVEADHPTARLVAAGSHPDYRQLERLERDRGGLARNISVDQVRGLGEMLSVTPSMSPWRAILIDSIDDLEASAANALLKMLEEPPANTLFLLVSHAPGRLLPTIRSRCRRLDLDPLADNAMTSLLNRWFPDEKPDRVSALVTLSGGSPGRALEAANLDLGPLEAAARAIMSDGDPTNSRRSKLASELGAKAAADRYAAFLAMVPALLAREARQTGGRRRQRALDAYAKARETAAIAPRLSLDPAFTVFQLGGLLASLSPNG